MCEVVEISDDDGDNEQFPFHSPTPSSDVEECSQSSRTALMTTSSGLNSAPKDVHLMPADRKKVV